MQLKRLYNHDAPKKEWGIREDECVTCKGKGVVINDTLDGVADCPDCEGGVRKVPVPPVAGIEILSVKENQHFSTHLVANAVNEGWMSQDKDLLTIKGANKMVTYRIARMPGYYCVHCGEHLVDGGRIAQMHVESRHGGEASPDPANPAGYEKINYYDCELVREA